jgi:hypothetical protein
MRFLAPEVGVIVGLLVHRDYDVVESLTRGQLLSADLIRTAVEEYGQTLIVPPDEAWDRMEVVELAGPGPAEYHVVFPLWTAEEGLSDLAIELRYVEFGPQLYAPQLVGIHAL